MCAILKEVTAVDASQFHANYDTFPEPLLLRTAEGGWLSNPAADDLCLSQVDYDNLEKWDDSSSIWLAGVKRFFYVQGHRTADGLFLLLHADAFLSSVALNLSSQLRQRLTSAFTGMSNLKGHLSGGPDTAAKEGLSAIDRSLHQILRMVTELERCSESELSCRKERLDLTEWLRRLGDELRFWCAPVNGITLHIDFPDTPLYAVADPNLLDHMVTHLVSNAIKAAPDGQAVVSISLKKDGEQGNASLTVSGRGANLPSDILADPLWNQPGRLLVGRGLGLGLPIAQRIAALHGGGLMVSSSKDGDSQVTLSLPLGIPEDFLEAPSTEKKIDPTGGLSMVRILLSDALPLAAFPPDFPPSE